MWGYIVPQTPKRPGKFYGLIIFIASCGATSLGGASKFIFALVPEGKGEG